MEIRRGQDGPSRRPIIAINLDSAEHPKRRSFINDAYVAAILEGGGLPLLIPHVGERSILREYLAAADGVLMVGGDDIDPARYGVRAHPNVRCMDRRRETTDFLLLEL